MSSPSGSQVSAGSRAGARDSRSTALSPSGYVADTETPSSPVPDSRSPTTPHVHHFTSTTWTPRANTRTTSNDGTEESSHIARPQIGQQSGISTTSPSSSRHAIFAPNSASPHSRCMRRLTIALRRLRHMLEEGRRNSEAVSHSPPGRLNAVRQRDRLQARAHFNTSLERARFMRDVATEQILGILGPPESVFIHTGEGAIYRYAHTGEGAVYRYTMNGIQHSGGLQYTFASTDFLSYIPADLQWFFTNSAPNAPRMSTHWVRRTRGMPWVDLGGTYSGGGAVRPTSTSSRAGNGSMPRSAAHTNDNMGGGGAGDTPSNGNSANAWHCCQCNYRNSIHFSFCLGDGCEHVKCAACVERTNDNLRGSYRYHYGRRNHDTSERRQEPPQPSSNIPDFDGGASPRSTITALSGNPSRYVHPTPGGFASSHRSRARRLSSASPPNGLPDTSASGVRSSMSSPGTIVRRSRASPPTGVMNPAGRMRRQSLDSNARSAAIARAGEDLRSRIQSVSEVALQRLIQNGDIDEHMRVLEEEVANVRLATDQLVARMQDDLDIRPVHHNLPGEQNLHRSAVQTTALASSSLSSQHRQSSVWPQSNADIAEADILQRTLSAALPEGRDSRSRGRWAALQRQRQMSMGSSSSESPTMPSLGMATRREIHVAAPTAQERGSEFILPVRQPRSQSAMPVDVRDLGSHDVADINFGRRRVRRPMPAQTLATRIEQEHAARATENELQCAQCALTLLLDPHTWNCGEVHTLCRPCQNSLQRFYGPLDCCPICGRAPTGRRSDNLSSRILPQPAPPTRRTSRTVPLSDSLSSRIPSQPRGPGCWTNGRPLVPSGDAFNDMGIPENPYPIPRRMTSALWQPPSTNRLPNGYMNGPQPQLVADRDHEDSDSDADMEDVARESRGQLAKESLGFYLPIRDAVPLASRPTNHAQILLNPSLLTIDIFRGEDEDPGVTRMGGGESYRPGGGEPYRPGGRARSPPRADLFRDRGRDRSPRRERGRTPPTDSWHPNSRDRSPRRRSRTPVRRDRSPLRDNWRTRPRSPIRARSPLRRFSPRRDDDRRQRSPLRRDERRRSRSPYNRDRGTPRARSPAPRRSPPAGPRSSYRTRSRSAERRDDRAPTGLNSTNWRRRSPSPPARDSGRTSERTSGTDSRRSSPPIHPDRLHLTQAATRDSRPHSPPPRREAAPSFAYRDRDSAKSTPRERSPVRPAPQRSPPRGPAGFRAPPTGPSGGRSFAASPSSSSNSISAHNRPENSGPVVPPSGPRGYVPSARGAYSTRGGRGSFSNINRPDASAWGAAPPARSVIVATSRETSMPVRPSQTQSPSIPTVPSGPAVSPPTGPSGGIPTGPRAGVSSRPTLQHASSVYRGINAPVSNNTGSRPHPAMAGLPQIIPGGRIDPTSSGIPSDVAVRLKRKEEEAEILREELHAKQEKLRQGLKGWDKLERDSRAMGLRSELSERHVRMLAGEGVGGAAF